MSSDKRPACLLFTLLVLAQWTLALQAQETSAIKTYARRIVDTLSSPSMHGRGYVSKGDRIAAAHIAKEFQRIGLKPLMKNGSWLQPFSFPVNSFPGKMKLALIDAKGGRTEAAAAHDFVLRSNSPSVKGRFPVAHAASRHVQSDTAWKRFCGQDLRKCFVVVDTSGVRNPQQLRLLEDFVRYPRNVKGILLQVKRPAPVGPDSAHRDCSRMPAWDYAQMQSTVPVVETTLPLRTVEEIELQVDAKFFKSYTSQNVLGYIPGSQFPDSFIVFTAHYDHLGRMGKDVYFPGANDNASGVAMLLSLAQHYAKPENKPKCSIAFIAFGAEEVGLIGSRYFTEHPLFPLRSIRFLVNMDILGTGDEGITAVNATLFEKQFKELQRLNAQGSYLPQVKPRGKASISDHYFFTERGVPCFYIYTLGGIKAYHDVCDKEETLPLTEFEDIFYLLRDFTAFIDNR